MEDVITVPGRIPSSKTVQTMRDRLSEDRKLLTCLDPDSDEHRQLTARIRRETAEMLDYEEQAEQQQRIFIADEARRRKQDDQFGTVVVSILFTGVGAVITYHSWGSWWLLTGLLFLVSGIGSILVNIFDDE